MSDSRIQRLSEEVRTRGWSVFLAWSPVAMGYLSGFFEGSHERFCAMAIHSSGNSCLIAPALSGAQATRAGIDDRRLWSDGEDPLEILKALSTQWDFLSKTIAIDMEMPAHMVLAIQSGLPQAKLVIGEPAISALRRVKEDSEIHEMKAAGAVVDNAFEEVAPMLKQGMTELDVQKLLAERIERDGGQPTFCTVAFGSGSAEPHHITENRPLQRGDIVLIDFGCEVHHYQSDITRVVCFGSATDEMKRAYETVFSAHARARDAIRAGVPCQDIDRAARKVIEEAGFGPYFFHRLGHGIGMQVHEAPYMVEGNQEALLAGECFSVEPGVYFEGKWGIRIENIVTATETGHLSLNKEPSPYLIEIEA